MEHYLDVNVKYNRGRELTGNIGEGEIRILIHERTLKQKKKDKWGREGDWRIARKW